MCAILSLKECWDKRIVQSWATGFDSGNGKKISNTQATPARQDAWLLFGSSLPFRSQIPRKFCACDGKSHDNVGRSGGFVRNCLAIAATFLQTDATIFPIRSLRLSRPSSLRNSLPEPPPPVGDEETLSTQPPNV